MRTRSNDEQIARIVYECELYWVRTGIPRRKVNDMLSELERHLREADEDGKPVEAVVGEDVKPLAEAWAEENRPPREFGKRLLIFATYFAISIPVFATFTHLWYRTLSFGVDLSLLLPIWTLAFGLSANLFHTLTMIEHLKPRWKGRLAVVVMSLVTVLVPLGVIALAFGNPYATLFDWSWFATLVSALVALLMYALRRRFVPDLRAFIRRRVR